MPKLMVFLLFNEKLIPTPSQNLVLNTRVIGRILTVPWTLEHALFVYDFKGNCCMYISLYNCIFLFM